VVFVNFFLKRFMTSTNYNTFPSFVLLISSQNFTRLKRFPQNRKLKCVLPQSLASLAPSYTLSLTILASSSTPSRATSIVSLHHRGLYRSSKLFALFCYSSTPSKLFATFMSLHFQLISQHSTICKHSWYHNS